MPVNSEHRLYTAFIDRWTRCRDSYGGQDDVKKKTTLYLPLLEGHAGSSGAAYTGYLARASFYPAMTRTVAGLAGLVYAKPPTVKSVPTLNQADFSDVTLTGVSVGGYGLGLCHEALITGRVGTLLDMPPALPEGVPPVLGKPIRPYWVLYTAEQVVNWQTARINGKQVLTLVVLSEEVEEFAADAFEPTVKQQFRVLQLNGGVYTVTIYTQDKDDQKKFLAGPPVVPTRRGVALPFIPFSFLSAEGVETGIRTPPLLPLVDVNLSHFRNSADHEHGAHFTALPTPWIAGHDVPQGTSLTIGSGNAWVFPNASAHAGMLEFTGAGLASLAALKEEKRMLMSTLGARMLETQKDLSEAAQTVRLRHAGESSAMSVLAEAVGQSLTQSIRWHLFWSGLDEAVADKALVTMNPDVMDELTSEDIRILVEGWQRGAISKRTLHYNLTWGEWTRPGVTFEEEEADIKKEAVDKPNPELPVVPRPGPIPPPASS